MLLDVVREATELEVVAVDAAQESKQTSECVQTWSSEIHKHTRQLRQERSPGGVSVQIGGRKGGRVSSLGLRKVGYTRQKNVAPRLPNTQDTSHTGC